MRNTTREWAEKLLAHADIQINGSRPWDIQVHNDLFFNRVARQGSLGLGESYMDGWWDVKNLDQFFYKILSAHLDKKIGFSWTLITTFLKSFLFNLQTKSRAYTVGEHHYNIGNDLYIAMLDKRLTYTCGYWKNVDTLDEAQEAKLDLACRKIGLKKDDRVLDIGCGWGSFLKFAAEKYGTRGTGVTVANEQVTLARELCKNLPIDIKLQDYRAIDEQFDHIVSLGMIEHVGSKNYRTYMETAHKCLKEGGLFLLHTIGSNKSVRSTEPWIEKYIFPNSMLPSLTQLSKATENLFVIEDIHNFGADYDTTLMAWFENFNHNWSTLKNKYSERFYRMWKYYLLSCAGSFRARQIQLWQIVLSKDGTPGGYTSIR
jgi:cyclopropane-fatty-acyl-phospholipid synthase